MIPQPVTGDPCTLAGRWGISLQLAVALASAGRRAEAAGLGVVLIISGFRTCEQQEQLEAAGRPAAACNRSTHTTCPATGADVHAASADGSRAVRHVLAGIAESVGLRVGGGGPIEADGLPVDWNHWDLGPRTA